MGKPYDFIGLTRALLDFQWRIDFLMLILAFQNRVHPLIL